MIEYKTITPEVLGAVMAMVIALIRVLYDGKEKRFLRILLEAAICGALSVTVSYGITAMGLDGNWSVFAGGMIGYLGSSSVRMIALSIINQRVKRD